MRKLLIVFAVLLVPSLALAGWNIRQNSDGSTVWVDDESKTVPVGDTGLTVALTDLGTAASAYIVSHKAGSLKKVYVTTNQAAETTLTFHISDFTSNVTTDGPTPVSSGATLAVAASAAGDVFTLEPEDVAESYTTVHQGDVIIVHTDGLSIGGEATVTFIVE